SYDWPGNVRELENAIQRAVILTESDSIGPESLPGALRAIRPAPVLPLAETSYEEQMRMYKFKLASRAVQECNGNKTLAARRLNITRAYLHRLLRQADEPQVA
ncbi:MAG: helix-turn-helix domain-containing protein, partial [Terriglobia bacterium]